MNDIWINTAEDLAVIFDTLNIEKVIERSLNYLSTKIECKNIHWLSPEELKSIYHCRGEYRPQPSLSRLVMLHSQTTTALVNVVELVKEFKFSNNFFNCHDDSVQSSNIKEGLAHFIVPAVNADEALNIGYFLIESVNSKRDRYKVCENIKEVILQMSMHLSFCLEHYRVRGETLIDDVTELYNQRYLPRVLDKEISRSKKVESPFTVLFLDVDHFKHVNDTRGHLVGSKVLMRMGEIISAEVRTNDYAFRYGGDEFVIVVVDADTDAASVIAEKIREKVEKTKFCLGGPEFSVTVSIGLASFPDHAKSSEQIIQMADEAMYYAKNKSRNIVYVTAS